jgi:hypothetical protein
MMINSDAKISSNEMYVPMAVCFCDIPVGDFGIHMSYLNSAWGCDGHQDGLHCQP